MNKRIYLSPPKLCGKEVQYVKEAFYSNWIAPLGPNVDAFENELCSYVRAEHGLALSSGTAGIHLVLRYLGVMPGDYVFCSSLTFSGSCNPIMYQYANPVFIDSEPDTWNMSPLALEKAFQWAKRENKMPKAVIIVDLYGQSADYDNLLPICNYYGVPVVEDAAEALGASYKGKKCGTFGDFGIFSFNGNKIITTSGGGMVVTNDQTAIRKMRFWATQAREPSRHYEHKEVGYNYRMSNICAGIGRGQLKAIEEWIRLRKLIRNRYKNGLKQLPIKLAPISRNGEPNYWLTVVTIDKNCPVTYDDVIEALEQENIESRPVWKPMNMQPVFKEYQFFSHYEKGSVGEELFNTGICLPSGSGMSATDQSRIVSSIKRTLAGGENEEDLILCNH